MVSPATWSPWGVAIFLLVTSNWVRSGKLDSRNQDTDHWTLATHTQTVRPLHDVREMDAEYWNTGAQSTLRQKLARRLLTGRAKNVILFLGDGLSIPTLAASRAYLGQSQGHTGEETVLSFEAFPHTGLSKTYCVDSQVADSACSATAYLGGVKANIGTIGVMAKVKLNDCKGMRNASNQVTSILKWSQDAGKSTGVVTTTRVTHASPAGAYSYVANRNWENDAEVRNSKQDPEVCDDIAEQLVNNSPGKNIKVILGGGRKQFRSKNAVDEEGGPGRRTDNVDLIASWETDKKKRGVSYKYLWNKGQLARVDMNKTEFLLGLFSRDHLPYKILDTSGTTPTLEEMTRVAIRVMNKNPNGYFLFVEGGRIDHAHHDTKAHLALDETVEFAKAVQAAADLTDEEDTLIVVTADHAHTMSISGYPARGNNILHLAGTSGVDRLPYATLSYANGKSYKPRYDLSKDNMNDPNYRYPAAVPLSSETHGGDDVAVFARGPWSHLYAGTFEQNFIPHVMAYASCVGKGRTVCDKK